MGIITKVLKQNAVYYPPAGHTKFGTPGFGVPVEIKCRWDDVHEMFLDPATGEELVSNAEVMTDQDVKVDGFLWLGKLADAPVDPYADKEGFPIRSFDKTPNFKATEFLRIAVLSAGNNK